MQTNTDPEYERLDQLVHAYERRDQDKKTEDETEHSDNIAFGNLQPMHTLQHMHTNTEPEYERLDQLVHTGQDKKMEDKLDCSESIGFGNLQSMRTLNLYTLIPTLSMRDWISWFALMKQSKTRKWMTKLSTVVLLLTMCPVISSMKKVDNHVITLLVITYWTNVTTVENCMLCTKQNFPYILNWCFKY